VGREVHILDGILDLGRWVISWSLNNIASWWGFSYVFYPTLHLVVFCD
jgi:hypothetical protein